MAVNITVYPLTSPRIVEIDAPQTEVVLQELIDAIRDWEDGPVGQYHDYFIDAAGKESLGGGVNVGITATLRNAQVYFPSRSTPVDSTKLCTSADIAGRVLTSSTSTFQSDGLVRGDAIINYTTMAMTTIISVDSETQLTTLPLTGGSRQDWQINDAIYSYKNPQGSVTGGNLVAVDSLNAELAPVLQSPLMQVVRTASSSATTQNLSTIEQVAFEGGISYDAVNGTVGTVYPQGTPSSPVNNLADAIAIQAASGVPKVLYIYGDFDAGSGDALTGWQIIGKATDNHIHLDPGSTFTDCAFFDVHLHGDLFGESRLVRCHVMAITGLDGMVEQCMLGMNTKTLAAAGNAHFVGCASAIAGAGSPTIDCNGNGIPQIRGYNGGVTITNKTSGNASIDLTSGHITIDATCTGGTIVARGQGKLTNNSGGVAVNAEGLSAEDIHTARVATESLRPTHQGYGNVYYVDPTNGLDTNDGRAQSSAFKTVTAAHTACVDGGNDVIQVVNPITSGVTLVEDIMISKSNVHLRATSRDITFKPATPGGSVITITGHNCSLTGLLVDGDKGGGTTANYCITIEGKFCAMNYVWLQQAVLDCLWIKAGDYHVLHECEIEKAGRHNVHIEDQQPTLAAGSPREITITGRANIHITDTGDNIFIAGNLAALGSSTRLIRILSCHLSDAAGYGLNVENNVSGVLLGDGVSFYNNVSGNMNIQTTSYHSHQVWDRHVEGMYSASEVMKLISAILAGKVSGAGTGTETFRDINDTKNRVISIVDSNGNRTALTLDETG